MVNVDALISPRVQQLWNNWELRIITILSMCLQIFLVLFAPRRKTTKSKWLTPLTGIAHYLADWLAAYGVGLISSGQDDNSSEAVAAELLAFWASFFLLHLAGADAINSGSLEDDYLWLKQLVSLVAHVVAILSIFLKSFPNRIWVPTLLVFLAGIINNARRVLSLLGRRGVGNLKDSRGRTTPAVAHTKLSETCSEMAKANMPIETLALPLLPKAKKTNGLSLGELPEDANMMGSFIVGSVISLHDTFKCFITRATFSSSDRLSSRELFRKLSAFGAFKVLELELNYMYEALYTQYLNFTLGNPFSSLNIYFLLPSLVIFGKVEKYEWHKFDVVLTYVLLSVALAQEIICICQSLSSPRQFLVIRFFCKVFDQILAGVKAVLPVGFSYSRGYEYSFFIKIQRWSGSVCHINLLAWCLGHHSKLAKLADKLAGFFCHEDILNIVGLNLSVSVHEVTEDVKEIIFQELRTKSATAANKETAIKICSQRGDWALLRSSLYDELKWSLGELEYGESLVLWHTATELCYNGSEFESIGDETAKRPMKFCKILSDYMLYLLVLKPDMMVSVAGDWETVFHDTCAHARGFFLRESVTNLGEACGQIMSRYSSMRSRTPINSDHSKSVLADASVLAKRLQSLQHNDQWELMGRVWVELLSYAAFHCEADIHAQQPRQGGELLTFVWLLINHLGFGKQVLEVDAPSKSYS